MKIGQVEVDFWEKKLTNMSQQLRIFLVNVLLKNSTYYQAAAVAELVSSWSFPAWDFDFESGDWRICLAIYLVLLWRKVAIKNSPAKIYCYFPCQSSNKK